MSTWNQGLTGKALTIAEIECEHLRVMAGPGTGKTFAMKRRVARLLEQQVDPDHILVVTFTRVAAAGLIKELSELGIEGCDKIAAGTLHAFCFGTLNRRDMFEFTGRVARPLVTINKSGVLHFEGAPLLQDIGKSGKKREDAKRIKAFEAAWARLQLDEPGWPQEPTDRQFHDALLAWLKFHNAMLIGEVVPEVLKYLRNNPTCPERNTFTHVIVDEYQDLNRADQALIDLLAHENTFIIGDENQSIYGFRHAHPDGINEYSVRHLATHDEDLDECRRCPTRVVEMANSLIMYNHADAATPRLRSRPTNVQGEVHILQWQSMDEEAEGLARFISFVTRQRGYAAGDVLVLSPRRHLAYKVRDALTGSGVPVHSFYHDEALEEDAAQEAFAYLTLLSDPEDRVALRFLLGFGSQTWCANQYAKLRTYCETTGTSPREVLEKLAAGRLELGGVEKLAERFSKIQEKLTPLQALKGKDLADALFPENVEQTKLLRELVLSILDEEGMMADAILDRTRSAITQPELPDDPDVVRIMSLQKSKGLTSKVVLVLGCIEGLIPQINRDDTPAEQQECRREQRRLFYVAMTRPTEILVLSSFATIKKQLTYKLRIAENVRGRSIVARTIASQFLSELGPAAPSAQVGSKWLGSIDLDRRA